MDTVRVSGKDFAKAIETMVPAHQRAVVSPGRALSSSIRPLLHEVITQSWNMVTTIFPPALCKTGETNMAMNSRWPTLYLLPEILKGTMV